MNNETDNPGKKTNLRKKTPWVLGVIVFLVIILLPASGFAFAASQESRDLFCGSCHSIPETVFLLRSTASQPSDLASYHTTQKTHCIDCHSGQGLGGRLQAEILGAGNAFKWYSGTAVQPAPLTHPIRDENCLKCHDQITDRGYVTKNKVLIETGEAENGHWHVFLPRWQSQDTSAGSCVSCHSGHALDGVVQILYLNEQHTSAVCNSCHQKLGRD